MATETIAVQTDVAGLRKLLNVPAEPTEARWIRRQRPGGTDYSVSAALRYPPAAIARVLAESRRFEVNPVVSVPREVVVSLFPPAFHKGDDATVKLPGTPVEANLFAKAPLIHGRALVMEDSGTVFVTLFTM